MRRANLDTPAHDILTPHASNRRWQCYLGVENLNEQGCEYIMRRLWFYYETRRYCYYQHLRIIMPRSCRTLKSYFVPIYYATIMRQLWDANILNCTADQDAPSDAFPWTWRALKVHLALPCFETHWFLSWSSGRRYCGYLHTSIMRRLVKLIMRLATIPRDKITIYYETPT